MNLDLDSISFSEWLVELDCCANKAGYKGQPFVQKTGQYCWHSFYQKSFSPEEALEAASLEALEFGHDYLDMEDNLSDKPDVR